AQETTSIPLSICTPLSPIACASEIIDNTSDAASTQRGQLLRRCAQSPTQITSNGIMTPAITVATLIIRSVISAVGVRSWNATDSASSVSDIYSNTSNHSTFLGTFIETPVSPVISRLLPNYSLGNSSPISL